VADAFFQFGEQGSCAVTVGLKDVLRCRLIHGSPPLLGLRGCCCVSSWFPCR
jgi:hypothetical protein